jgi:hypothetical protein
MTTYDPQNILGSVFGPISLSGQPLAFPNTRPDLPFNPCYSEHSPRFYPDFKIVDPTMDQLTDLVLLLSGPLGWATWAVRQYMSPNQQPTEAFFTNILPSGEANVGQAVLINSNGAPLGKIITAYPIFDTKKIKLSVPNSSTEVDPEILIDSGTQLDLFLEFTSFTNLAVQGPIDITWDLGSGSYSKFGQEINYTFINPSTTLKKSFNIRAKAKNCGGVERLAYITVTVNPATAG